MLAAWVASTRISRRCCVAARVAARGKRRSRDVAAFLTTRIPTSLWLAPKRVAAEDDRSLSDWIVTTLTEVIASRDRERSSKRRQ